MNIKQIVKEIFSNIKKDWYLPVIEHQTYSTEEQVIGVWTDGKPLYRKVFQSTSGNGVIAGTNILGVDYVVSIRSSLNDRGNTLIASATYGGANWWFSRTDNSIHAENLAAHWNGLPVSITVEYTKTTDTPTTKKVPFEPLVEYSTDEKMIGYWVDGKPLYQKTLVFNNLVRDTDIAHGVANIDRVVSFDGYVDNSNMMFPINYSHPIQTYAHAFFINETSLGFRCGTGSGAIGGTVYITIKYTKTTD